MYGMSDAVIQELEAAGNVVAYFNGHNHAGNYGVKNGIHYVNLKGMVETSDTTSFSIVRVFKDRLEVDGFGREIGSCVRNQIECRNRQVLLSIRRRALTPMGKNKKLSS